MMSHPSCVRSKNLRGASVASVTLASQTNKPSRLTFIPEIRSFGNQRLKFIKNRPDGKSHDWLWTWNNRWNSGVLKIFNRSKASCRYSGVCVWACRPRLATLIEVRQNSLEVSVVLIRFWKSKVCYLDRLPSQLFLIGALLTRST